MKLHSIYKKTLCILQWNINKKGPALLYIVIYRKLYFSYPTSYSGLWDTSFFFNRRLNSFKLFKNLHCVRQIPTVKLGLYCHWNLPVWRPLTSFRWRGQKVNGHYLCGDKTISYTLSLHTWLLSGSTPYISSLTWLGWESNNVQQFSNKSWSYVKKNIWIKGKKIIIYSYV